MAAPQQVQSVADIMAELAPAAQPTLQNIDARAALIPTKFAAQKAGLEGAKTAGFNQINDSMTGRGMSFSGMPGNEMANYLAEKYLPGMQAADYQQNAETLSVQQEKNAVTSGIADKAVSINQSQKATANDWEKMLAEQSFTAGQNAQSRQSDVVSPQEAALSFISQGLGSDGFVSPSTFQLARDAYKLAGGDTSTFAKEFWKYTGASTGQKNQGNIDAYYHG